jgi:hypothetical protein
MLFMPLRNSSVSHKLGVVVFTASQKSMKVDLIKNVWSKFSKKKVHTLLHSWDIVRYRTGNKRTYLYHSTQELKSVNKPIVQGNIKYLQHGVKANCNYLYPSLYLYLPPSISVSLSLFSLPHSISLSLSLSLSILLSIHLSPFLSISLISNSYC